MAHKTYANEWLTFTKKNLDMVKLFERVCEILEIDRGDLV